MTDIQTLYSLRPHDLSDEDLDLIIADLRAKRHTFNTTAKTSAGAKPKASKTPSETAQAAQTVASLTSFDL